MHLENVRVIAFVSGAERYGSRFARISHIERDGTGGFAYADQDDEHIGWEMDTAWREGGVAV